MRPTAPTPGSRRTRVAIVGVGSWGVNHVRTFAAEPRAEVTWLCDPHGPALARAQRMAPAARACEHIDGVLAAADVDAIVISTPAPTHAELACAAIASGRHVLVEKPLALSVADADRVVDAARRAGVVVMVGHLMLYHPAVERLRALVASGELGELLYLTSTRVNLGRLRRDESALWSFGPHDFSMIDFVVGRPPVAISARGASYLQAGIPDVVFVHLEHAALPGAAPVIAQVHLSWLNPRKERRLTVVGARKMVEFDDCAVEKLRIFDRGYDRPPEFSDFAEYLTIRDGDVFMPHVPMTEPLAVACRHFLDCVVRGEQPRTDVAAGARVVRLLAAAQASLDGDGAPVAVAP